MSRLCILVLVAFVSCVAAQDISSQAYLEHEIIPDVLSVVPAEYLTGGLSVVPAEYLTVQYPSGAVVQEGKELTPTEVKDTPSILWNASPDQFYIVVMADPDAPTREAPTARNWWHWLIGNVPGTDIASGETIGEYVGSAPPQNSGLHRYVFLVYQQPSEFEFDEPRITNRSTENRRLFSIDNLVEKYNLGDPIAGNFYQAEWDDYVPILQEQLGL